MLLVLSVGVLRWDAGREMPWGGEEAPRRREGVQLPQRVKRRVMCLLLWDKSWISAQGERESRRMETSPMTFTLANFFLLQVGNNWAFKKISHFFRLQLMEILHTSSNSSASGMWWCGKWHRFLCFHGLFSVKLVLTPFRAVRSHFKVQSVVSLLVTKHVLNMRSSTICFWMTYVIWKQFYFKVRCIYGRIKHFKKVFPPIAYAVNGLGTFLYILLKTQGGELHWCWNEIYNKTELV